MEKKKKFDLIPENWIQKLFSFIESNFKEVLNSLKLQN